MKYLAVWDPGEAQYRHSVPTLVLRGKADPITAGGQADYVFEAALLGPRYLVEFDGIGHELNVPSLHQLPRFPKGVKTKLCGFREEAVPPQQTDVATKSCIIESFMTDELETFDDVLTLYHEMNAPSSDRRSWISDNPVTCDFATGPIDRMAKDNQKSRISVGSITHGEIEGGVL